MARRTGFPAADATPADVEARAVAALDRLVPAGPVGIAVSGGSDSVALMHLTHRWAAGRRTLRVATVDHCLRAEAAQEAAGVVEAASSLGIAADLLRLEALGALATSHSGSMQQQARHRRLAALRDWAGKHGLGAVLLGHTMDDRAETLLLRLARGSGLDGLAVMGRVSGLFRRPLLDLRREELRAWLAAHGIGWVDDPSNEDPRYDRVRARRALADLAPLGIDAAGLAATAERLADHRRILDAARTRLAEKSARAGSFLTACLRRDALCAADPTLAADLLADTLRAVAGAEYPPRRANTEGLLERLRAPGKLTTTLHGTIVSAGEDAWVRFAREPAGVAPPVPAVAGAVWDGRIRIAAGHAPGWTVGALGEDGLRVLDRGADHPEGDWWRTPRDARRANPALRDPHGRIRHVWDPATLHADGTQAQDLVARRLHAAFSPAEYSAHPLDMDGDDA